MAPLLLLTGFMGSGKSTIGRKVARRLGWRFIDLDEAVSRAADMDIPAIFAAEGERGFRAREAEALAAIVREERSEGTVVALGGGTLTEPEVVALVKDRAAVVYLDVEAGEAWRRVCSSDRPLARDQESFVRLLEARRPLYEEVADMTISVSRTGVDEVVAEVVRLMERGRGAA